MQCHEVRAQAHNHPAHSWPFAASTSKTLSPFCSRRATFPQESPPYGERHCSPVRWNSLETGNLTFLSR